MSGFPKADMAAAATAGVITIDQLMKAIEGSHEGKESHAKKHYGYAAVSGAVAAGALMLLLKDEKHRHENHEGHQHCEGTEVVLYESDSESDYDYERHRHIRPYRHYDHHHDTEMVRFSKGKERGHHERPDHEPAGHTRRLVEEILATYSIGREITGHRKNHLTHVLMELLGGIATIKDAKDHVHGME